MNNDSTLLAVLNPGGRDADQDFPDFAGVPDAKIHAPVNFHAYAAATGGAFLKSVAAVEQRGLKNVILLLRSDLKVSLKALQELQAQGCRVWISFKEAGLHQIAQTLQKSGNAALFAELCQKADGALASTQDSLAIYRAVGAKKAIFIPTPYPLEDARWDFSIASAERRGVFVGTREFDIPSRNHALALLVAFSFGHPVTVVNEAGRTGRKQIESLAASHPAVELQIIEGRRSYPEYLQHMARHRMVWQCDASAVPGQVAGDALLCGIPCLGGNGTTERLAFPNWTSCGRTLEEVRALAEKLLAEPTFYDLECASNLAKAREIMGFAASREPLAKLFGLD